MEENIQHPAKDDFPQRNNILDDPINNDAVLFITKRNVDKGKSKSNEEARQFTREYVEY